MFQTGRGQRGGPIGGEHRRHGDHRLRGSCPQARPCCHHTAARPRSPPIAGTCFSAGSTRNRRDAAIAYRARDRIHAHRRLQRPPCSGPPSEPVDIVAVAPGKIISGGRNKTIQPFDTSVVRSILVRDGERVKSRRCSDRTRRDDEHCGIRAPEERPVRSSARHARIKAALSGRGGRAFRIHTAERRATGAYSNASPVSDQSDRRSKTPNWPPLTGR